MDIAGTAVGIASLGKTVCHGLLSYYEHWKEYKGDIQRSYASIALLGRTLASLEYLLLHNDKSQKSMQQLEECMEACNRELSELSDKLRRLRAYQQPVNLQQKTWTELQRLSWPFMKGTLTKLKMHADNAQSQLGLALSVMNLEVNMEVSSTSRRIVAHLQKQRSADSSDDMSARIITWLEPSDPTANHSSACQHHEKGTCIWLAQSKVYQDWRSGAIRHLWLYGKAGCGKTILCSQAIEDIQKQCSQDHTSKCLMFYFSFSDERKQTYRDLLVSLLVQVDISGTPLMMLRRIYELSDQSPARVDQLQDILVAALRPQQRVYLMLDGLDESVEAGHALQQLLDGLVTLQRLISTVSIFVTSRLLRVIDDVMAELQAGHINVPTNAVDQDIEKYISQEMLRSPKLASLDDRTRELIKNSLAASSDGM